MTACSGRFRFEFGWYHEDFVPFGDGSFFVEKNNDKGASDNENERYATPWENGFSYESQPACP